MGVLACSYVDQRQIRHGAVVQAERLYEAAAVLAIKLFCEDPGLEKIGPATALEFEIREPETKHSISLQQVERWLAGATTTPREASKKAKLKMMLVQKGILQELLTSFMSCAES